jgi:hypothetical protein
VARPCLWDSHSSGEVVEQADTSRPRQSLGQGRVQAKEDFSNQRGKEALPGGTEATFPTGGGEQQPEHRGDTGSVHKRELT